MGTALVLVSSAVVLVAIGVGFYALFAKGRRKKVAKIAGGLALLGFVIGMVGGGVTSFEAAEQKRVAGGFDTVEQMEAAEKVGAETKAEYDAHLAAEQAEAERREAEAKRQAEEAERQAAAEAAREAAACRQDLSCWGDKYHLEATFPCEDLVERTAKYDFEWTDGMLEPKLSHFRWLDQEKGLITFLGDKVKFQNGFGAWSAMIYECDYDPTAGKIIDIRVEPGRL